MKIPQPISRSRYLERPNRFAARLLLDGGEIYAYVPNTGRMTELMHPDNLMYAVPATTNPDRKTSHDLLLVEYGGTLVSVDSRLPSLLLAEAIGQERLNPFIGYTTVQREATLGRGRLDLLLTRDDQRFYVETKSVNLVEDGLALFPDAPTTRGVRHLEALAHAVAEGHRAAIVFVIQRSDAHRLRPFDEADPDFGTALRSACLAGVEAFAFVCQVGLDEMKIDHEVPVELAPDVKWHR